MKLGSRKYTTMYNYGNVIRCCFFFVAETAVFSLGRPQGAMTYKFPIPFPRPPAPKVAKQRGKEGRLQIMDEQSWHDAEDNMIFSLQQTPYHPCMVFTYICLFFVQHTWMVWEQQRSWTFMVGRRFYPFGMAYLQGRTVSFGEIERYHSCWINGVDAGLPSKILQEEWLLPSVARRSFWGQGLSTTVNYTRIQMAHESICKCIITSLLQRWLL